MFVVSCLCAEWCDTCVDYRPGFFALAEKFPTAQFRWIDIGNGTSDTFPGIENRFSEASAPGLTDQDAFTQCGKEIGHVSCTPEHSGDLRTCRPAWRAPVG